MEKRTEPTSRVPLPYKIVVAVVLALLLGVPAYGREGFVWETSLTEAMDKATKTDKPLLITMHTSTEEACVRMLTQVYPDPEVQAQLAHFVVLPTCIDDHKEALASVNGEMRSVSTLFGGVSCDILKKNEKEVRERFFGSSDIQVPQHIFVDGQGNIFMSKAYELNKTALLDLLEKALITHGKQLVGGLNAYYQTLFKTIWKGPTREREEAVQTLLNLKYSKNKDLLFPTIQGLKKDRDRAVCIRAMGYAKFKDAAPIAMKWLDDRSTFIRNCAVVTLEEMRAAQAIKRLLELYSEVKNGELKKDIVRALGPCGAGNKEAKDILLAHARDKDMKLRAGAYLSLGHFLKERDVVDTLKESYRKEGGNVTQKIAILWAFKEEPSAKLAAEVEEMVAAEKNQQLKVVAMAAVRLMKEEVVEYDDQLISALRTLYAADKIVRNEVKDWVDNRNKNNAGRNSGNSGGRGSSGGGRGPRGGRGGRGGGR